MIHGEAPALPRFDEGDVSLLTGSSIYQSQLPADLLQGNPRKWQYCQDKRFNLSHAFNMDSYFVSTTNHCDLLSKKTMVLQLQLSPPVSVYVHSWVVATFLVLSLHHTMIAEVEILHSQINLVEVFNLLSNLVHHA